MVNTNTPTDCDQDAGPFMNEFTYRRTRATCYLYGEPVCATIHNKGRMKFMTHSGVWKMMNAIKEALLAILQRIPLSLDLDGSRGRSLPVYAYIPTTIQARRCLEMQRAMWRNTSRDL